MGGKISKDDGLYDEVPLPCDNGEHWKVVQALAEKPIKSFVDLAKRMAAYCDGEVSLDGLEAVAQSCQSDFFATTLPCIIRRALDLPSLRRSLPNDGHLRTLRQGVRAQLRIQRQLAASLLANMLLLTFERVLPEHDSMNAICFRDLLQTEHGPEFAKLQMHVHYFERIALESLRGEIVIDRMVGMELTFAEWLASEHALLPMEMAPEGVGFETCPELAHADFANMFIGGGALSGGCVQEEIRFSICPELCVSMLVCPCMLDHEAIQIVGAEQFSAYEGYAFSLAYGGDYKDRARRTPDGSLLTAVLAMDANDLRGGDSSIVGQLREEPLLRDLNKSLAAFTPVDEEALRNFEIVATGNWGCGAFLGSAPIKALTQWASASQCRRRLRYFPFDQSFGPQLREFAAKCVDGNIKVGQLLNALHTIQNQEAKALAFMQTNDIEEERIFELVAAELRG